MTLRPRWGSFVFHRFFRRKKSRESWLSHSGGLRLRSSQLRLGLQPVIQIASVDSAPLLVEFVGTTTDLLLKPSSGLGCWLSCRDQGGHGGHWLLHFVAPLRRCLTSSVDVSLRPGDIVSRPRLICPADGHGKEWLQRLFKSHGSRRCSMGLFVQTDPQSISVVIWQN
jgi:hypothetical protein